MPTSLLRFLLPLYGLIICSVPLSRVMIGAMPLYVIDVLALSILALGVGHLGTMHGRHRRLSWLVVFFLLALLPTSLLEFARMEFQEPLYMLLRTVLHVAAVWSLAGFLRNPPHLRRLLAGVACGVLLTSIIATLNSLPITGAWTRAHLFTVTWLKPSTEERLMENEQQYRFGMAVEAERGNSLIGQSNITGCVIAAMLPFLLGALRNVRPGWAFRTLLVAALVGGVGALLFTYSRSTYLALAVMILAYMVLERRTFSRRILPIALAAAVIIGAIGVRSAFFKFDFIAEKFDLTSEEYAGNNRARVLAYTRPVELLISDPTYLIRGAGRTDRKLREENEDASILKLHDAEMHSVFAASIFYRGFISMATIFWLYFAFVRASMRARRAARRTRHPGTWLATASIVSLLSLLPPWVVTHYLVSSINGHTFLFFVLALAIASLEHTRRVSAAPARATQPARPSMIILSPGVSRA